MILCKVGCSGRRFRHTFFHQIVGFKEIVPYQELFCVIMILESLINHDDDDGTRNDKTTENKNSLVQHSFNLADRTTYGSSAYIRCQTLEKLIGTAMRLLLVPLITNMTIKLSNQEIQKVDKTKFIGIIIDQHLTSYHKSSVLIIL